MKKGTFLYTLLYKFLYIGRDMLWKDIFITVKKNCKGDILDVGGRDFFLKVAQKNIAISSWTTLEPTKDEYYKIEDSRYRFVIGDGCNMKFKNNSFDTVINFHVLEHVFEPIRMIEEISRVLKKGGTALFLVPQTATLHMAPYHYYNFTRYWIEEAMKRNKLSISDIKPLGGLWKTVAARLFYFFLMSMRVDGMSSKKDTRSIFYYLFFPFMALYSLIHLPVCLLLSLGDLTEDANDYLVIAKKQ